MQKSTIWKNGNGRLSNLLLYVKVSIDERMPLQYKHVEIPMVLSFYSELQLKEDHCPVEQLNLWKKIVTMLTDGDPATEVPQFKWRRNAKIGLSEEREASLIDILRKGDKFDL